MKNISKVITAGLVLVLTGLSCKALEGGGFSVSPNSPNPATPAGPTPTAGPTLMAPISANQPFRITGSFKSTNEIGGKFSDNVLYSERQVLLIDMHGFITRNKEWEIPVTTQVIGSVLYNPQDASGNYTLLLPEIPQGSLNDVDNNDQSNTGVQVFAIDYEPNIIGDPFMSGNDALRGWPGNMASIRTTPDIDNEVLGGKLIIYSPDKLEQFPSDFGTDGKLFTGDDPVTAIPAGYSIVDLDSKPFKITQPAEADLPLYETPDAGPKDFSSESYTQAFDHLLAFLRTDYAFSGIAYKQPDWDALSREIRPRVEKAEKDNDSSGYFAALRDFTYAFKDGHVGIDGGEYSVKDFQENYAGSLGFTVRVLDNNQVLVDSVLPGASADNAGMKVGATLTQFNSKPVMDAIKSQVLFFGNRSSDISILYEQALVLTRTKPEGQAQVSFTNPDGSKKTANLTAIPEVDSLLTALGYNKSDSLVPVELRSLSFDGNDIGYIKINTNIDDLNLLLRLYERGLQKFMQQNTTNLIIDLRNNGGGIPLGLAGYLTNQNIILGQLEYYDVAKGQFAPKGEPRKFRPKQPQYQFDKIAVLVGLNCASACEIEAYGFSQIPGTIVVGQYPSGGIEAEVSKGQIKMPEGISMQFPTGRVVNLDGSLFLEGVGVQPTLKVPINATTVLTSEDIILQTAEKALIGK